MRILNAGGKKGVSLLLESMEKNKPGNGVNWAETLRNLQKWTTRVDRVGGRVYNDYSSFKLVHNKSVFIGLLKT